MSGVLSVSLSSTPPLATPSPVVRGSSGKRGAAGNVVSFRSGLPEDGPLAGSLKNGGLSRSLTEGLAGASLGRSLGRGRTAASEGAAPAAAARPLQSTASIPKSAAFVKIEGFDTAGLDPASPAASPPPSPAQTRALSSLLSRQLSTDRLPGLAGSPALASPLLAAEEPLGGLVGRLEAAARVAPMPRPAPPRRGTVPDDLLQQLQVCACPCFRLAVLALRVALQAGQRSLLQPEGGPVLACQPAAHRPLDSHVVVGAPLGALPPGVRLPHAMHSAHTLQPGSPPPPAPQAQHSVFGEPVCVRAFSIARFAHDGKYRASGDPAFLHCVEVARILAELGAGEATVAGAWGRRGARRVAQHGAGWVRCHVPSMCSQGSVLAAFAPRRPPSPRLHAGV